ncbi:MAG: MATE family efflux transporter [Lachnospiraceae bacterium]|nr:MATE family efflux transporter [Lachnospiraceae bacterium]
MKQITKDRELLRRVITLSIPAVLAQVSSIIMQYIDAAMVGSLGAKATAAIGLVSSTTWLFGGLCAAAAAGFSVQVAQLMGAGEEGNARKVLRQALLCTFLFGLGLMTLGIGISRPLPLWLRGEAEVAKNSTRYFFIYACALPAIQLRHTAGNMLQCSGDMRTPSQLNILMCFLDILFNSLLIFPTRSLCLMGFSLPIPGAGLGVAGAALGTALAELVTALLMLYAVCFRSSSLRLSASGSWRPEGRCLKTALRLSLPMALEHTILCGAQIAGTRIVAPLGTVSVAANSLGVTAESLCYMPGYGIGAAATTLVGQSIGAGEEKLARDYARLSVLLGMGIMTCTGGLMFLGAPFMFSLLTPDPAIRALGTRILRIEAFAEPMFAASIVAAGALRGAGDTLVPGILNLASMWGVRITLSLYLAPRLGLTGVWLAMCIELCVRGILFLARLLRGRWLTERLV